MASRFTSPNGVIDPNLLNAMHFFGLIKQNKDGAFIARHNSPTLDRSKSYENRYSNPDPVILLSVGELDIRNIVLKQLSGNYDFLLPNFIFKEKLHHQNPNLISFDLVQSLYKQILDPLIQGLNWLKGIGFEKIFLLIPPPCSMNDDSFFETNQFRSNANVRNKIYYSFNLYLKNLLAENNLSYIDIWNDVTVENVLNESFMLDSVHLNSSAASIIMSKLINSAFK